MIRKEIFIVLYSKLTCSSSWSNRSDERALEERLRLQAPVQSTLIKKEEYIFN